MLEIRFRKYCFAVNDNPPLWRYPKSLAARSDQSYTYTGVKSQEKILNEQNAQTVFREALVTPTIKHLYSLIEGVTSASSKTI